MPERELHPWAQAIQDEANARLATEVPLEGETADDVANRVGPEVFGERYTWEVIDGEFRLLGCIGDPPTEGE